MDPLAELLQALDLAPLGGDAFQGRFIESLRARVFGGELLAQSLIAAARTAVGRTCHSLHVAFLSPGDAAMPVEYRVRRVRDGRRFAQRQVSAWQRGREIVLATVSLAADDAAESAGHQQHAMPPVPGPEGLASELDQRRATAHRMRAADRAWLLAPRAVEIRQVHPVPLIDPPPAAPVAHTWLRAVGELPADPNVHRAVLAYASDMTLLDIACYPYGVSWTDPRMEQASLDHAMWFHRPFRADEWLLHAQGVPTLAAGRALAEGRVFGRDGRLVASVVQEGLSRLRHD
jgi:acyl-CoA thioesterase-2